MEIFLLFWIMCKRRYKSATGGGPKVQHLVNKYSARREESIIFALHTEIFLKNIRDRLSSFSEYLPEKRVLP